MNTASIFTPDLFKGQTLLITGGGSGIGLEIARFFGNHGARLLLAARDIDRLAKAGTELQEADMDVDWFELNIRDNEAVDALFEKLSGDDRLPDCLINNAGGQFAAKALDISANGFRSVVDLNLNGTWHMSQAMARHAIASNKPASIINIVLALESGLPGMAHSAAARAGVVNMTKTLAYEWGRHNIRVNAIAPGTIATEGLQNYDPEQLKAATSRLPIPRFGDPIEVAQLAAFLASPAASFMTGTLLELDGGEHMTGASEQVPIYQN